MNKETIAQVIEVSTVKLTSDETRMLLRASQTDKPINSHYGSVSTSLVDLGLLVRVPLETPEARAKRLAVSWRRLKSAGAAKDYEVASKALKDIEELTRDGDPPSGLILTEIGKQVARGVAVKINRR